MNDPIDFKRAGIDPDALFFSAEDLGKSNNPLVNLIRNFFYQEKITNREYINRYYKHYIARFPDGTKNDFALKAGADRLFVLNPSKITLNMATTVLEAMGFKLDSIQLMVSSSTENRSMVLSSN